MKFSHAIILMIVCSLVVVGCKHNELDIKPDGKVNQRTSTANVTTVDPQGRLVASYHGVGASATNLDDTGVYSVAPGAVTAMYYKDGKFYISSPGDVDIRDFKMQPGASDMESEGMSVSVGQISVNISAPLIQMVQAYNAAVEALKGMTQIEAEARIKEMQAAGEITRDVAALLLQFFVPTLPKV